MTEGNGLVPQIEALVAEHAEIQAKIAADLARTAEIEGQLKAIKEAVVSAATVRKPRGPVSDEVRQRMSEAQRRRWELNAPSPLAAE